MRSGAEWATNAADPEPVAHALGASRAIGDVTPICVSGVLSGASDAIDISDITNFSDVTDGTDIRDISDICDISDISEVRGNLPCAGFPVLKETPLFP